MSCPSGSLRNAVICHLRALGGDQHRSAPRPSRRRPARELCSTRSSGLISGKRRWTQRLPELSHFQMCNPWVTRITPVKQVAPAGSRHTWVRGSCCARSIAPCSASGSAPCPAQLRARSVRAAVRLSSVLAPPCQRTLLLPSADPRTHMYRCEHTQTCTHVYRCTHADTHTRVQVCTHIYRCAHTQTRSHTCRGVHTGRAAHTCTGVHTRRPAHTSGAPRFRVKAACPRSARGSSPLLVLGRTETRPEPEKRRGYGCGVGAPRLRAQPAPAPQLGRRARQMRGWQSIVLPRALPPRGQHPWAQGHAPVPSSPPRAAGRRWTRYPRG